MKPFTQLQTFVISCVVSLLFIGLFYLAISSFLERVKETGREEARQQHRAQIAKLKEDADKVEASLRGQLTQAQNHAILREQTIRTLASAVGTSSAGLRDALGRVRADVHTASPEANAQRAATLAELLESCQDEYRQLAEKADRHVSDVKTLNDAWPQLPPQQQ